MNRIETDVAVIGGGTAGLPAAVAAAEAGARVAVLEKGATTGGTGNMGMGPLAVESRLQRVRQMALTREDAFNIFMDYTHWRVDARLVKAYIDKSASTIDWLEAMGVAFAEPAAYFPGSNFTWHVIKDVNGEAKPGGAAMMIKHLTDRASELGVQFLLQTPARKILKEGDRVAGVLAEDRDGEEVQVAAGAVVVATGGFGNSPEMVKKYTNYVLDTDIFPFRIPGLVGEGIRMAWAAGAAPTDMNMEVIYGIPDLGPDGPLGGPPAVAVFRQPNLMVNLQGERFMNEAVMGNTTFTGNAIAAQQDRMAFNILDADSVDYYMENGFHFLDVINPGKRIGDFEAELGELYNQGNRHVYMADSIEELAEKIGVDRENLLATLEDYNRACDTGRDELFHKKALYLKPVRRPRFYAARLYPSGYGSLGGIKINYKAEVLTRDWAVIPGLFAAGTDACTIYGDSYIFVLPGNTMGFAINTGRIAGENAAKYVRALAE